MKAWAVVPGFALALAGCRCDRELGERAMQPPNSPSSEAVQVREEPHRLGRRNVVLVTVSGWSAEMPWNGYSRPIAPNLTRLEGEAVSFTRAFSVSSHMGLSVAGMLTGAYPSTLARDAAFFPALDETNTTLAERLSSGGVRTMAAHAHSYFENRSGLTQGFDIFRTLPGVHFEPTYDPQVTGADLLALAQQVLSEPTNTAHPFFAWIHFIDPLRLYKSHESSPSWGSRPRDRYDEEVYYTDLQLRKLLDFVEHQPWYPQTVVIVTSDHGEVFNEDGEPVTGFEPSYRAVHVPLFVVGAGIQARRIEAARSQVDLAPTILEMTGVSAEGLVGKSLVPEIMGEQCASRDVIIDVPKTSNHNRRWALVRWPYKLVSYGEGSYFALFDVATDPDERHELQGEKPEVFEVLRSLYERTGRPMGRMEAPSFRPAMPSAVVPPEATAAEASSTTID